MQPSLLVIKPITGDCAAPGAAFPAAHGSLQTCIEPVDLAKRYDPRGDYFDRRSR
jgi:hypothetical protein